MRQDGRAISTGLRSLRFCGGFRQNEVTTRRSIFRISMYTAGQPVDALTATDDRMIMTDTERPDNGVFFVVEIILIFNVWLLC